MLKWVPYKQRRQNYYLSEVLTRYGIFSACQKRFVKTESNIAKKVISLRIRAREGLDKKVVGNVTIIMTEVAEDIIREIMKHKELKDSNWWVGFGKVSISSR